MGIRHSAGVPVRSSAAAGCLRPTHCATKPGPNAVLPGLPLRRAWGLARPSRRRDAGAMTPYTKSAIVYDALFRRKDYRRATRSLVRIVKQFAPGAASLLDVGCG